ncbi:hypothetical protein [Mangrovicoccus algicola]|uniref:Uncharacterized protein n=1 Tax=Mangrovicoccus algicola TaxID=2771008 RepID=A0A8J7CUD6_9RHOB|nr:hypothetical protein [Mangrovicoccus algicola]MBE3637349.1 hypothetical protein [Mangrovicoccus algicola]
MFDDEYHDDVVQYREPSDEPEWQDDEYHDGSDELRTSIFSKILSAFQFKRLG